MIETGNPVMHAIGPVVASGGRIAVTIFREYQAVFRLTMIVDGDVHLVASLRSGGQQHIQCFSSALKFRWLIG